MCFRMNKRGWLLLVGLTAAACGDSSSSGDSNDPAKALPCDVQEVMAKCTSCHADPPIYGAPMPLTNVDDFSGTGKDGTALTELVLARVRATTSPMPPAPAEALTDAEVNVLSAWFDAGMPARAEGESCEPTNEGGAPATLNCTPDVVLSKKAPYTMPAGVEDETKCFGMQVENNGPKRHIVGLGPAIDNATIVHHFLVFRTPNAESEEPFDCALFPPKWELLYAWAPGAPAYELPEQAGFPLESGETANLVIQMHYNNYADAEDLTDDTRVDMCTTDELRQFDAGVMSFGGADFVLPPNTKSELTCDFSVPTQAEPVMPVHIFQSWPHMHSLGRAMQTTVTSPSGDERTIVDTNFSFESQLLYPTDIDIDVGDRVRTICSWENSTNEMVPYGEETNHEMCFNIVGYYPAITSPQWSGGLPVGAADCTLE
jgi:hypothetical protein